ncbi:MAG: hypothetical protein QG567_781 [Campylobacterota bacterium]|nr:hypothetical protein [Campylobacterota bacterium]
MIINIKIQDNSVAERIFWMLQHFKNDGVVIERLDSDDINVETSIKTSLMELQQVKNGTLKPQLARDFLNDL